MFEINLIPDTKAKMVAALRQRNLILFICIIVSAVALAIILVLLSIKGGQDIAMNDQDTRLALMSDKLSEYSNLDEVLTIQNQLGAVSSVSEEKLAASRLFGLLNIMMYQGQDEVTLSSLDLDLQNSTITMEGQANALVSPYIDYRVLESFKKSSAMIHYDYGRYVDEGGEEIPIACIEETDADGVAFSDENGYYVNWYGERDGCHPSGGSDDDEDSDDSSSSSSSNKSGSSSSSSGKSTTSNTSNDDDESDAEPTESTDTDDPATKIYRTPLFGEWYKDGHIDLDGTIHGVAHFASQCVTYTGSDDGKKWTTNYSDSCLVSDEELTITESSNGRDEDDQLVLRFAAEWNFNPEVFLYNNFYMELIGPSGQNVTDSYIQIEGIFSQKASDCAKDDTDCLNNTSNSGGEQ